MSIAFICSIIIILEDIKKKNIINKSYYDEKESECLTTPKEDTLTNQIKVSVIKSIKI